MSRCPATGAVTPCLHSGIHSCKRSHDEIGPASPAAMPSDGPRHVGVVGNGWRGNPSTAEAARRRLQQDPPELGSNSKLYS